VHSQRQTYSATHSALRCVKEAHKVTKKASNEVDHTKADWSIGTLHTRAKGQKCPCTQAYVYQAWMLHACNKKSMCYNTASTSWEYGLSGLKLVFQTESSCGSGSGWPKSSLVCLTGNEQYSSLFDGILEESKANHQKHGCNKTPPLSIHNKLIHFGSI
jgi:hypothetical protein